MRVILLLSFLTLSNALNLLNLFGKIFGDIVDIASESSDTNIKTASNVVNNNNTCGVTVSSCPTSAYRTFDGSCNNLKNPSWGTPNTTYLRLLPANYGDGMYTMPTSKSGKPLLSARAISTFIFTDKEVEDPYWTINTMQWGQLLAHDMSHTTAVLGVNITCCTGGQNVTNQNARCANIAVPSNDDVHPGQVCLNFLRTLTTKDANCAASKNVPADPLSEVTAYMDASIVYGSSESEAKSLRTGSGGRLISVTRNGQEWPPQAQQPSQACRVSTNDEPCYRAGDIRVNQNTELTLLQILFLRKHNKVADYLRSINNNWDDETTYQETRKVIIAQLQHMHYNELLAIYLGRQNMLDKKLLYTGQQGYINDYNPNCNPGISVEHASAAFRYFHSAIAGFLQMYHDDYLSAGSVRLSTWLTKPSILENGTTFVKLARGINTQAQMAVDPFFHNETTVYLFRGNNENGTDLRAIDIQRGRDHGVPSYNDLRAYCGLPRATTFQDFSDYISSNYIQKMSETYETPDDVEATVGGSLERHVNGSLVGPTFLCVLLEQFYRTRTCDRYFYENGGQDGSFTPEQLATIRNGSTIASLFCDVAGVESIQSRALERISIINPVVSCSLIPTIDLDQWKV